MSRKCHCKAERYYFPTILHWQFSEMGPISTVTGHEKIMFVFSQSNLLYCITAWTDAGEILLTNPAVLTVVQVNRAGGKRFFLFWEMMP